MGCVFGDSAGLACGWGLLFGPLWAFMGHKGTLLMLFSTGPYWPIEAHKGPLWPELGRHSDDWGLFQWVTLARCGPLRPIVAFMGHSGPLLCLR